MYILLLFSFPLFPESPPRLLLRVLRDFTSYSYDTCSPYGVASVSRIDKITGRFRKGAL